MRKFNLTLSDEAYNDLENLRQRLEAPDHAVVFKKAVGLLESLLMETMNGGEVILRRSDGEEKILEL